MLILRLNVGHLDTNIFFRVQLYIYYIDSEDTYYVWFYAYDNTFNAPQNAWNLIFGNQ